MAQRCSATRFLLEEDLCVRVKGINEKMISDSRNPDYKYDFGFRMMFQIKPPFLMHASAELSVVKVGLEHPLFNRVPQSLCAPL